MSVEFKLPELGENVEKGDVVRVLVNVGDMVAKDQPVVELETDKATIEVPSSVAGRVAAVRVKAGDKVKVRVLDVDAEKERISLGIKQLASSPMEKIQTAGIKKGDTVTCEVTKVEENGIEVKIAGSDATAFIRRSDLARDRSEQRPERFAVGEKVDAKVTQIEPKSQKITVSIKALEIAEEKEAVAQYGSSDSGASLGDILGAALNKAKKDGKDGG